ncbi:hypothetical protein MROS_2498 [Melioribacter roseus P3M-2]|uniref:Uncharacterized protein n=1 Tax=Melioribacter roseus (strain DSM 23840 / JCM 17771 / VKM B-2668 / P3M-2) TaxID=1191523 RepID=I7A3D0_MELRP|nr:hypothetical protein [Melioribacter roseus]AFN75728.1 hypothetical protein MROS_2498 [Melioribacter roseus P3M-2]
MFKNYLYLLRAVIELRELIIDHPAREIYTQEKDKLFISIPDYNYDNRHLIISTNPQMPYLLLRNNHSKAKKITEISSMSFCLRKLTKWKLPITTGL